MRDADGEFGRGGPAAAQHARRAAGGAARAGARYWRNAVSRSIRFGAERCRNVLRRGVMPMRLPRLDAGSASRLFVGWRTDLTLAARMLIRHPALSAIAVFGITVAIARPSVRGCQLNIAVLVYARTAARQGEIIREGLMLSVTGVALGLVGALCLGRAGSSLLFGVTASDPLTFATVSLLLTAVAVAACYFPARRAMKVDPTVALRVT